MTDSTRRSEPALVMNAIKEWSEATGGEGTDAARDWAKSTSEVVAFPEDRGEWQAQIEEAFEAGRRYEAGLRGDPLFFVPSPLETDL